MQQRQQAAFSVRQPEPARCHQLVEILLHLTREHEDMHDVPVGAPS